MMPACQRHCFYLSCPPRLLVQLQVLFGQSCIFILHLLQLDLLSRKSRNYTKVLCVTPLDYPAEQLHCSCFLIVQDAGGMLLNGREATVSNTAPTEPRRWGWTWMTFKVSSNPNQSVISWASKAETEGRNLDVLLWAAKRPWNQRGFQPTRSTRKWQWNGVITISIPVWSACEND